MHPYFSNNYIPVVFQMIRLQTTMQIAPPPREQNKELLLDKYQLSINELHK